MPLNVYQATRSGIRKEYCLFKLIVFLKSKLVFMKIKLYILFSSYAIYTLR
jgi:hypothetical protein